MNFYIVDAFTNKAFGGNTAGVVLAENISSNIMQNIATELRFSETVFIEKFNENLFKLRYFTPNSEVNLCGHATIAGFKVLHHRGLIKENTFYNIQTNAGILSVFVNNNYIFMEAGKAIEGKTIDKNIVKNLSSILGIQSNYIGDNHYDIQPQVISTGLHDIILPIKNADVLNRIKPDVKKLAELSKELNVVGVHAFTLASTIYTAECRNFAPLYEINEEAATGTSNASLTYYLFKNNIINSFNKDYLFLQGENMGRPSEIITRLYNEESPKIFVGGTAYILTEGQLML